MEEVKPDPELNPESNPPAPIPVHKPTEEFDDPLSKLMSLQTVGGIPMSTRCKLCKSSFRKEAEDLYDKSRSHVEVKKFLDEKGDVIDIKNVQHHLKEHYGKMESAAYMLEYAERAREMMEHRRSDTKEADLACTIAFIEVARALALQTNNDIGREKERNEIYSKAMREWRAAQEFRKSLTDEDKRVQTVKEKVLQTWRAQMESAKSPEQKEMIREMLKNFKATYETL